ncbi:RNA polymerase subunit sigma-24 [Streptomyces lunaelactis]|uniref:RNA polymerase subunit sigma-24 n=1 Tax=Streptomyces lunaelactis TaxID=1535768 RepID=A0A2R4T2Q4_9ACTN|nr:DUF742 domain-containing protein [Streptomyces lunaelactis]AVZ73415.1 RNA polymerase subunit sigma-24 [Streptomyces lunaelactis]NUK02431.1 DUF742 domain-containing protein [Streptomyces lunaelactis]NUK09713.1 DUF742 domain-containing protein [Streptomyces lunaelactis]NUK16468.1 DUF742 domain-containing protein [Streptomyces lunaelactis]NUK25537.1 DUF742 domain-containing protein [Streptomyces lunaelactis]
MTDGSTDGSDERTTRAVRPYVITGGRSDTGGEPLSWETLVMAVDEAGYPATLQPEHRMILTHCQGLLSVAEVAAHLGQPPSVVQVLLSDLIDWGLIVDRPPIPPAERADVTMLRKVLHGLESRL